MLVVPKKDWGPLKEPSEKGNEQNGDLANTATPGRKTRRSNKLLTFVFGDLK